MTPSELVGWTLHNMSAVTAITSTRIYHGLRPVGTTVPCINFFQLPGATYRYGFEVATFTVNCRSAQAEAARDLARLVIQTFHGSAGTGMYGVNNSFDVARVALRNDNGLVPEPTDGIYNAPVDIQVAYQTSTVS